MMVWYNVTCCCQHINSGSLTLRLITPHLPKSLFPFLVKESHGKIHISQLNIFAIRTALFNLWSSPLIPGKKLGKYQELDGARLGCLLYFYLYKGIAYTSY